MDLLFDALLLTHTYIPSEYERQSEVHHLCSDVGDGEVTDGNVNLTANNHVDHPSPGAILHPCPPGPIGRDRIH